MTTERPANPPAHRSELRRCIARMAATALILTGIGVAGLSDALAKDSDGWDDVFSGPSSGSGWDDDVYVGSGGSGGAGWDDDDDIEWVFGGSGVSGWDD